MYVDDFIKGTKLIIGSEFAEPLKLGSDQLVTINRLIDIVEAITGIKPRRRYDLDAPQGVRGRNSDNTPIQSVMGWAPSMTLEDGMECTYRWIYDVMQTRNRDLAQLRVGNG